MANEEHGAREPARKLVAGVGAATHGFLDVAERVDELLSGRRTICICAASLGLLAAQYIKKPGLVLFGSWLLVLGLLLVAAARIGACREDDGQWSWDLVRQQVVAAFDDASAFASDFVSLSLDAKAYRVGRVLTGTGVFLMATTVVSRALHVHWMSFGRHGFGIAIVGFALFGFGWWKLHGKQLALKATGGSSSNVVPAVVDAMSLRDVETRSTADPLEMKLYETLSTWNAKEYHYEAQYEHDLVRHINKTAPELLPRTQMRHQSEGGLCRFDIVVGDSLVIELKKRLNQTQSYTAAGQLGQYARAWQGRGAVVMVVAHTEGRHVQLQLRPAADQLRREGFPVVVVTVGAA